MCDSNAALAHPLLDAGTWEATGFLSYTHGALAGAPTYGHTQPGILEMTADVEGIGSGLTMVVICNVGAVPLATGQPEGWRLLNTPLGDFNPLSPIIGVTYLSLPCIAIDRGA